MSAIQLKRRAAGDVATPPADTVAIFVDDATGEPSYKDEAAAVSSLVGEPGDDGELDYQDHGNTGSTETVDASAADVHRLVANAATVTLTLSGWPASGTPGIVRLWLEQDGTGGRDWVFPGSVDWGDDGEPDWTERSAGEIDIVDLMTVDGGTVVKASIGGRPGPAGATGPAGADGTDGTGALTLIASSVLGAPASSFSFTPIAGTWNHLRLVVVGRCSGAVFDGNCVVRFNNDSGNNYDRVFHDLASATTVSASEAFAQSGGFIGYVPGASGPANVPSTIIVDVPLYDGTTFHKAYRSQQGFIGQSTGNDRLGGAVGTWRNTAAITRVDAVLTSGTNFVAGSAAFLYGIT